MKSVVYGAGAIGSVLGAELHKNGKDVSLVARPNHANAINEMGLRVIGIKNYTANIYASTTPSSVEGMDLVFLTVKTQDTENAVREFAPYLRDSTPVISLQNGVRNPEIISAILGEEQVIPGVVRFMASYLQPGEVKYTWEGTCIIGEQSGKITDRIKLISEYLSSAIQTDISQNIVGELWVKLILNLINAPLTITGYSFPFGLKDRYLRHIVVKAWNEGREIVKAAKIKANFQGIDPWIETLADDVKFEDWLAQQPTDVQVHPSTHQSLVRGSTDESDFLTGEIIRLGEQTGMSACVNTLLMHKLREIRQNDSIVYTQPETLWNYVEDVLKV